MTRFFIVAFLGILLPLAVFAGLPGYRQLYGNLPPVSHEKEHSKYFIILMSGGRVGSTMLQFALDVCPSVRSDGEIIGKSKYFFNRQVRGSYMTASRMPKIMDWVKEMDNLTEVDGTPVLRKGFKAEWDGLKDALPFVRDKLRPYVIVLRRRNRIKRALSYARATQTGRWHAVDCTDMKTSGGSGGCMKQFTVNMAMLKFRFDQAEWMDWQADRFINEHFSQLPTLVLDYEDIEHNLMDASNRIFEFLQVDDVCKFTKDTNMGSMQTKKLTSDNIKAEVRNYESVHEVFAASPYLGELEHPNHIPLYIPVRRDGGYPFLAYNPATRSERHWSPLTPVSLAQWKWKCDSGDGDPTIQLFDLPTDGTRRSSSRPLPASEGIRPQTYQEYAFGKERFRTSKARQMGASRTEPPRGSKVKPQPVDVNKIKTPRANVNVRP